MESVEFNNSLSPRETLIESPLAPSSDSAQAVVDKKGGSSMGLKLLIVTSFTRRLGQMETCSLKIRFD